MDHIIIFNIAGVHISYKKELIVKKYLVFLFIIALIFVTFSCATTARSLYKVSLKMSKAEVVHVIGQPESVALSQIDGENNAIEVLEYRLYQYAGAIDGLSPYYNIYALVFVNNELIQIVKIQENARLTEQMAWNIVTSINPKLRPVNTININVSP